jgi:flagellar biosynthesis component FlhA
MVPSWIVMGIICILWVLLLNLIILHIYLNCKGYTTYQFIVARREQERQEEEEKTLAKQKEEEDKMKAVLEEQKLKLSKRNANAKNKL